MRNKGFTLIELMIVVAIIVVFVVVARDGYISYQAAGNAEVNAEKTADRLGIDKLLCTWSDKYSLCFCGNDKYYTNRVLVIVPDRVCEKR